MKKLLLLVTIIGILVCSVYATNLPDKVYIQEQVRKMIESPEYAETVEFCLWYAHEHFTSKDIPSEWLNDKGYIAMFKVAMEVEGKRLEWEKEQKEKE